MWPDCSAKHERGELDSGQQIVVTVTGHGLKDIDTALSGRGPVQAEVVAGRPDGDRVGLRAAECRAHDRAAGAVTVEVPATSANLGPGFDCFGLALDWRERIDLTVLERGFHIDVSGEGADAIPRDESHLIIRSALVGLADLGVVAPGLRLSCHNTIPHGRGLGSSSAAIVAGLVAAAGLAGADAEPAWLLRHANAIEGHPDNVAAAIYGGFVLAYEGRDGRQRGAIRSRGLDPGGDLHSPVGGVDQGDAQPAAGRRCRTSTPRPTPDGPHCWSTPWPAIRPGSTTPRTTGCTRAIGEPAMPRSYELVKTLRNKGFAAVISGAGPSVLVLGETADLAVLPDLPTPGFLLRQARVGDGASIVPENRTQSV